jgi:hypothetical protein
MSMDEWYRSESAERAGQGGSWIKETIQLILIVALVRIGMMPYLAVVDGYEPNFHTSERVLVIVYDAAVRPGARDVVAGLAARG